MCEQLKGYKDTDLASLRVVSVLPYFSECLSLIKTLAFVEITLSHLMQICNTQTYNIDSNKHLQHILNVCKVYANFVSDNYCSLVLLIIFLY